MDRLVKQTGYLVIKNDGAVLESAGELENDESFANIINHLINLTESIDENFIPNNGCERISIVYADHCYNICLSNRRIHIVKLRIIRPVVLSSIRNGQPSNNAICTNIDNDVSTNTLSSTIVSSTNALLT